MSEISVTVNGSTTINPTVGNGDVVNVTFSAAGERGPRGDTGAPGPANLLTIGTVITGPDAAAALSKQTITNGVASQTLDLTLPQGATGAQGPQGQTGPAGPPNTLTIGTVTKGDTASATLSSQTMAGGSATQTLSLVLPKGDKGDRGDAGPFTTIQVGTTTTGAAGSSAKVDTTTAGDTVTLNFTVPRGYDGTSNLGDEIPQPLGTASAGSAAVAARADHVHALPTIAYNKLTGVPTTFAPSAHTHAISDVTNLQAVLDAKQASGSYATLDGSGKVPSSQLPSFVDDVVEGASLAAFPATGEAGKLYVAIDTRKVFRWSGSTYVEIASSPGSTDAVPEGSTNLYFTTGRAAAAAPVQSVNGKTGNVTIEAGGIAWSTAPTTTTTTTKAGQISYDANYVYVATAVDTWRRAGLEDWATPTITITTQPSDQTAVGNAATFTVQATATQNAELLYQWQRQAGGAGGWVNIATGLSATLSLADLSYAANNGDKYRVVITSGAAGTGGAAVNGWLPAVVVELTPTATVTSGEATLTVLAAISIVTQPQSVTLTSDTSASFSLSATTPGTGLSYQWQSSPDGTNWTNISGATSATLAFTGITQTAYDGKRYRCIVSSSGYDDATSNAALLTVAPITVTTQPASKTATPVAGTEPAYTASFTVAGTSPAGPPSLQWQVSTDAGSTWSDVSGATSASLSLSALTWSDSGKRYRARLNKTGWQEVASNAAILTVPSDSITVTQQPANTTAAVSQFSATSFTLPSGTWYGVSYANNQWFATPSNSDLGGDYLATSGDGVNWTKTSLALPSASAWEPVQYGGGLYLTYDKGTTKYATSTDGATWTARTFSADIYSLTYIDGLGWFAITSGLYWVSNSGTAWASTSLPSIVFNAARQVGTRVVITGVGSVAPYVATITSGALGSLQTTGLPNLSAILATSGSVALFGVVNQGTMYVVDFAANTTTTVTLPENGIVYAGTWDSQRSRWIVAATAPGSGSATGGIYTIAANGSSIAKRASIAINYVGNNNASLIQFGSRAVAYVASGDAGWYTSDDGGLSWTARTGPSGVAAKPVSVAGRIVAPTSSWTASSTSDTGSLVDPGGSLSAQFAAAATTTFGAPSVQWQVSTDAGANWSDVSGATSPTLSLTPVTADSGKRYRARFTKSQYTAVNSTAAILTVN